MAKKKYVSIFVSKETRNRLKIEAVKLGKTLIAYLEEFSKQKSK